MDMQPDHNPFKSIRRKPLVSAPKRLQRMMQLQWYNGQIKYDLVLAYLAQSSKEGSVEAQVEAINIVQYLPLSEERLREIQIKTECYRH